jgi:hypothetical protein
MLHGQCLLSDEPKEVDVTCFRRLSVPFGFKAMNTVNNY